MDPLALRLRAERERQGLSIRDVSVVTKIREPYIEAIERGRYDVMPAVYVRSFVKTLGSSLGIPSKEIHTLMSEVFDGEDDAMRLTPTKPAVPPLPGLENTVQKAADAVTSTVSKAGDMVGDSFRKMRAIQTPTFLTDRPRFVMLLAMVLALVIVVAFVWVIASGDSEATDISGTPSAETSTDIVVDASSGLSDGASTADSMQLKAVVTDTAWLTITTDGLHTQQHVLIPSENYSWFAKTKFVLNISNAGGVRFYRDGESLPLFGKLGETVRSVTITRTDVVSSATPYGSSSAANAARALPATSTGAAKPQSQVASTPVRQVPPSPTPKPAAKPVQRQVQRRAPVKPAPKKPAPKRNVRRNSIQIITPAPVRQPN